MCTHTSLVTDVPALEAHFGASVPPALNFAPSYHINAYAFPRYPILTHQQPGQFQHLRWGLVPHWVKSKADADKLRVQTINARSETIFEKPSYRQAASRAQRCIIPVTGFFEWHTSGNRKYPFYLTTNQPISSIAGLWDEWPDPETGEIHTTFSLLTTAANPLLAAVHNEKKRMPCLLTPDAEHAWLHEDLTEQDALHLLSTTYPDAQMHSHPVSKRLSSRTEDTNAPDVLAPITYPELSNVPGLVA